MFRESFKYYKSKKEKPKLDKIVDLHSGNINMNVNTQYQYEITC